MRKKGNEKYAELLMFTGVPNCDGYSTKRIIQEVHLENQTVVSKLDCDLGYIHINKQGRSKEFDLVKSRFEKSSKKLFARCDENLSEIVRFGTPTSSFLKKNGIRLTFLTEKGNYSISGDLKELDKRKIIGQTITHFLNLMELTNPGGIKKIIKNSK
ncbi:hypothetical protein [Flagellimonas meridianipacifica]|uniref:Uncharacterized protein n=1 Tax=Flagellimonas meridianipacifica TaxID=1080225 RepID=A0A2T0MAS0_9FLAO|nr:hypothetical protein [Allomuricauda pacifica]PRX54606.1 hypothetical protein CLV81_3008 [Allomuricauda pacifica]